MIVEYIRYQLTPERVEAFLAAYGEAQTSLRASPHCLGYELSRCTDAPEVFVLRIEWASHEAHLKGFRASAEFPPFLRAVGPFVPSIEEMRHYDVTPLVWSRALS
jgi:quinol monooxygenase YgiN